MPRLVNSRPAFTLIELGLALLIIAILASLALPFFGQGREGASLARVRMDYELIRSALALLRHEASLAGSPWPARLDAAGVGVEGEELFSCPAGNAFSSCVPLLATPITSSKKAWMKTGENAYRFYFSQDDFLTFAYDPASGGFECVDYAKCASLKFN